MDVLSAIQKRRSIRQFSARPLEDEKLNKVLEAGRLAPSAANQQAWKFIVVKDTTVREKMAEALGGQEFVKQAPVILVACGGNTDSVMMCGQHKYTVDVSIAVAYMTLQAAEVDLGTCWLGRFDEKMVKEILGVPEDMRVVAITPLGYPAESPAPRPRKKLSEIVCYDKFE